MGKIEVTLDEREDNYGSFQDNANLAQFLKQVMSTGKSVRKLSPVQSEALDMIASKLSRILGGDPNYKDNWHDICGYATLVLEDLEKQDNEPEKVKS